MNLQNIILNLHSYVPIIIGGTISVLALYGAKELIKEAKLALQKPSEYAIK